MKWHILPCSLCQTGTASAGVVHQTGQRCPSKFHMTFIKFQVSFVYISLTWILDKCCSFSLQVLLVLVWFNLVNVKTSKFHMTLSKRQVCLNFHPIHMIWRILPILFAGRSGAVDQQVSLDIEHPTQVNIYISEIFFWPEKQVHHHLLAKSESHWFSFTRDDEFHVMARWTLLLDGVLALPDLYKCAGSSEREYCKTH